MFSPLFETVISDVVYASPLLFLSGAPLLPVSVNVNFSLPLGAVSFTDLLAEISTPPLAVYVFSKAIPVFIFFELLSQVIVPTRVIACGLIAAFFLPFSSVTVRSLI